MDAHPRSDPPPKYAVLGAVELLYDDEDDALVPLAPTAMKTVVSAEGHDAMPASAPALTELRLATGELVRFVAAVEPVLGWRRILFVVSGICLRPSRAERMLRESTAVLLKSVDPSILDAEKEASS